jgi:quercetin dioxygenase-like cupin family protein
MARIDDVFEYPVLKARAVVTRSAQDTRGDLTQLEVHLSPHQTLTLEHAHPVQKERLTVLSGSVHIRVNGVERTAGSGQQIEIPPRAAHLCWNAGDSEAVVQAEFRPALQTEDLIAAFCGLAQAGRVSPGTGLPEPMDMAALLHRYRNEVQLTRMPQPIQSALFAALAFVGKLRDDRARRQRLRSRAARLRVRRTSG